MTKIITNVVSIIYEKLNKEFKDTKETLDKLELSILDTEIKLLEKTKQKRILERKIEQIELKIVESLYNINNKE